jgi:hypothetical protein
MERTFCANEHCPKHTEGGGRFRKVGEKWYCYPGCAENLDVLSPGKNLWDFSTTHIHPDAKPVYVGSLANMRRLESQYGVSNHAANNYERNW